MAILEMRADSPTATGVRGRAIAAALRSRGHHVDVIAPEAEVLDRFARMRFSFWSRLKRRALRRRALPHLWDYLAEHLEARLRRARYDVIVGRAPAVAYVLTRRPAPTCLYDMANIAYLEHYHSAQPDLQQLPIDFEKEIALFQAADAVLSPHPLLTWFFEENVPVRARILEVGLGCDAPAERAQHSERARIVYAGSYAAIQDPYLLALLTRDSPYPIDCFGDRDPNLAFLPARLRYCGYRPTLSFLAEYQAGLITVSSDRLRRYSPSTKFQYYFSYGLPVLYPEWMIEGRDYRAAVPYTEGNFAEAARSLLTPKRWQYLSEEALAIAATRRWPEVLRPLVEAVEGGW